MRHHIATVGRYSAHYADSAELIEVTAADAPLWKFQLDTDADLSTLAELVDACPEADADELRFMIELATSAATIIEHAAHDIARYGEIGVTA